MKYLKKFENHSQYESYIATDYAKPNVSLCVQENHVHYNPKTFNHIITYEASAKLPETTATNKAGGLHVNCFKGANDTILTVTKHEFENGVGTIEFDDDVVIIMPCAFYQCNFTSIKLPETVIDIQGAYNGHSYLCGAFASCSSLTSVTIPNSVTTIGENCFNNCSGLTSLTIGSSVTNIGASAFYGCSGLTSLTIGSSVTSIGGNAFGGCASLTSVTIPNSVTSIDYGAFRECSSLTNITIPNSVTSIGNGAFNGTPWWNSYSADTNNQYGNIVYINVVAYKAVNENITSIIFKNDTISISSSAFYGCSGLTSVTIPNSVTSIGGSTFGNCSGLTSVTIGDSVTSIGNYAFENCKGLTNVTIPDSVTSIGDSAFASCTGLTSVTSLATTAPTIEGNQAFYGVKTGGTLYVPQGSTSYDAWMNTSSFYLGYYNWTKVEQ